MHDSFEDQMSAADALIDRAASQIQHAEPAPEVVSAAADRVWQQLAGKHNARRGMKLVRGDQPLDLPQAVTETALPKNNRWGLWALAALLVLGVGVAQLVIRQLWPAGPSATVQTVDGQLFRVESAAHLPLAIGDEIREGQVIRSGRDGGAVLVLQDGSLVEMSPRSELAIEEGRRGTTLDLSRGNVIVEAAEQRARHLFVATDDCLVSVTGTIFSVNHGTKGSRVSVIEGEVRVDHSGIEDVLHSGDQVTTHKLLSPLAVADEIAWSKNVDSYLQILREYSALKNEIEQRVPHPELRFSSHLLDLMPPETVIYVAAPNVAEAVTETHRVFQERLAESPALQQWLAESANSFQGQLDEVIEGFSELGGYLGEEVAVGGQFGGEGMGAVVIAEVVDSAGLRAFIERQIDVHAGDVDETPVFIDDPAEAGDQGFWIWFHDSLAVGSHSGEAIRRVASHLAGDTNPFVGTPFHQSISELYRDGAEFVAAADLYEIVGTAVDLGEPEGKHQARMAAIGVDNVRHLMFEQKRLGEKTHHRVAITFDEARHGLASWLAEPAPMGGLGFVSPDAKVVLGAVFKDPALLLDDLFELSGEIPSGLREFEQRHGLSLRNDVAAAIGGELVIAVDGPLLPEPAIKVIVEIYDPARFQWAIEQALAEANTQLAGHGEEPLVLQQSESRGRTFYTLPAEVVDIHYTFVEGYLLMASNRALLDQAIRYRDSGYSITDSAKFQALLPRDGHNNVSILGYQNFSGIAQTIAEKLAGESLTEEQQAALSSLQLDEPMLGYAYGEPRRIIVAAASDGNMLQSMLMRGFGVKNPAGFESLFGELFKGGPFEGI